MFAWLDSGQLQFCRCYDRRATMNAIDCHVKRIYSHFVVLQKERLVDGIEMRCDDLQCNGTKWVCIEIGPSTFSMACLYLSLSISWRALKRNVTNCISWFDSFSFLARSICCSRNIVEIREARKRSEEKSWDNGRLVQGVVRSHDMKFVPVQEQSHRAN